MSHKRKRKVLIKLSPPTFRLDLSPNVIKLTFLSDKVFSKLHLNFQLNYDESFPSLANFKLSILYFYHLILSFWIYYSNTKLRQRCYTAIFLSNDFLLSNFNNKFHLVFIASETLQVLFSRIHFSSCLIAPSGYYVLIFDILHHATCETFLFFLSFGVS